MKINFKKQFIWKIIIILIICFSIAIIYGCYLLNYIPHKKYENSDFNIPNYISNHDQDQDGIDDQTDIMNSVREYIATNPKYKSKYYENGYPNDEYGVCTDIVAFGLKGAGYDLMTLVYEDEKENREAYQINRIDKNIDFRRVANLKVYCARHFISLTTDINQIKEWQGGDIVIFKNHIGIISDKRNKNGIPFVIHNGSPYQRYYEEDILKIRKDIVGHYRVS